MKTPILRVYIGDIPQTNITLSKPVPTGLYQDKLNTLVDSLMNTAKTELNFRKINGKAKIVLETPSNDFPNMIDKRTLKTFKL
jgi:hypothetical protein